MRKKGLAGKKELNQIFFLKSPSIRSAFLGYFLVLDGMRSSCGEAFLNEHPAVFLGYAFSFYAFCLLGLKSLLHPHLFPCDHPGSFWDCFGHCGHCGRFDRYGRFALWIEDFVILAGHLCDHPDHFYPWNALLYWGWV